MSIEHPSRDDLERLARSFELTLTDDEMAAFDALFAPTAAGYDRLDELGDETLGVKYPREDLGSRPAPGEYESDGWVWRCSIPGAAEGPLAGRTVGIKDNACVAEIPMLNGSPVMEGYVPTEDATVVTRLLDAGAHIIGKTAVPAFCFDGGGITGYPDPQPTNPHDPAYMCGSSSNGSAAVVVNGQADMALGGDQGGSIRLPSSWSGCCGHKPTYGLVPYTGIFPIELTIDHTGPMARTVADCALMLEAIAGEDGLDPRQVNVRTQAYTQELDKGAEGLRAGILSEGFGIPDASEPDVDEAVRSAAAALESAGASVQEISVPLHSDGLAIWAAIANEGATELMVRGNAFGTNHKGHYTTDLVEFYGRARRERADDYSITVKLTVLTGAWMADRYHHRYYAKAQNLGRRLRAAYAEALERCDVLVMPTTAMKAKPIPTSGDLLEICAAALGNLHNTSPFDVTGNPALSVPCGESGGLPIGMMLVGRHFDDATVLRVGHAYQRLGSRSDAAVGQHA
jgi:amidase